MRISDRAEPARPGRGEGGVALLEAVLGLTLTAMIVAAAMSAFVTAGRGTDRAAARMAALSLAETILDEATAPATLREVMREGAVTRRGEEQGLAWNLSAAPYLAEERDPPGLVELAVEVAPASGAAPLVALRTLRAVP